jgi:hypothetical protein
MSVHIEKCPKCGETLYPVSLFSSVKECLTRECGYVHKPEPNEAAESARTRGSRPASRPNEEETMGSQLAPVLRPDCVAEDKHDWNIHESDEKHIKVLCSQCWEWRTYYRA